MFGYVTVGKNQMTEEEYNVFSSYYCGVCKAMGKSAGQISRLGLSYDITFLALVLSSISGEGESKDGKCIVHPIKKRNYILNDSAVMYASLAGVVLSYLKLKDDLSDDKSFKALLGMIIFYRGAKYAQKQLVREYSVIKKQLEILNSLEKNKSSSIDDTAESFGKILECLFTPEFITDEGQRRSLAWLGLNLGRWIYTIDAVNDLESDIKTGAYNPFIEMGYKNAKQCKKDIELTLTLNLDGIATAFELIDFKKNKNIIAKIIYISLKEKQRHILSDAGENKNESL